MIDEDDQFRDVNGDGLPEIVVTHTMGHDSKDVPKKIYYNCTGLYIIPIAAAQTPVLRIIFDPHPFKTESTWRWQLVPSTAVNASTGTALSDPQRAASSDAPDVARQSPTEPSIQDVILEQRINGEWTTQARFVWSADSQSFQGPSGSKAEGFIASTQSIEEAEIVSFLAAPESKPD